MLNKIRTIPEVVVELSTQSSSPSSAQSLAIGTFSPLRNVDHLQPSPTKKAQQQQQHMTLAVLCLPEEMQAMESPASSLVEKNNKTSSKTSLMAKLKESSEKLLTKPVFQRGLCSFLRVADLDMDDATIEDTLHSTDSYPNFTFASMDPPPGMDQDPLERWIALDDGDGKQTPIAPFAVRALARTGFSNALNETIWTPADHKTTKLLQQREWYHCAWPTSHGPVVSLPHNSHSDHVLVWSGNFAHGLYGSDLPAVRAAGFVATRSPEQLLDLLVDSNRVREYNKLSLGRTDLLVLQAENSDDGPFGGITKVMKSISKPPLVRKPLQFTSILHSRSLEDGSGYEIVTRAVTTGTPPHDASMLTSEILLGVTLLKRIQNQPGTFVITVNHIRSPMIPMMIAKRIGVQAAVNFIHDVRGCAK